MDDLMGEAARARREEIHWLMAASAYQPPDAVGARYAELEANARKESKMDELISRLARQKREKQQEAN